MGVTVKIARNDFRRRGREVQARIAAAIDRSLDVTESIAKQLVPVDTGALKASIKKDKTPRSGSLWGTVVAGEDYAHFVEFGTVNMIAQPYMTPAIQQGRYQMMREMPKVWKD